jgi:hypothetical protein
MRWFSTTDFGHKFEMTCESWCVTYKLLSPETGDVELVPALMRSAHKSYVPSRENKENNACSTDSITHVKNPYF